MEIFPPDPSSSPADTGFRVFPRVSPLFTLVLTALTMGIYVPYWLFTRTRILNRVFPQHAIPWLFVLFCLAGYLVLLVLGYQLPQEISLVQLITDPQYRPLLSVAASVNLLLLVWTVLFCQRINRCTGKVAGDPLHASYPVLVLSNCLVNNVYYLQYKINQVNDTPRTPGAPVGTLQA